MVGLARRSAHFFCASAMIFANGSAATAGCGSLNTLVARTVPELQTRSLFAIAVDPKLDEKDLSADKDGNLVKFVGNSFLIEQSPDIFNRRGYFATALHNLEVICSRRANGGDAPYWLVAPNRERFPAMPVAAEECDRIQKIRQTAGGSEVVFAPDVAVIEAASISTEWKPVLVGSLGLALSAANGNVQTLNGTTFTAVSTQTVGLPTKPWHNLAQKDVNDLWSIAGNNLGGTSGSPYIAEQDGVAVVLGVVARSVPPTGVEIRYGDVTLTANEVSNLLASQYPSMEAGAYSLLFGADSLADAIDGKKSDDQTAELLAAWEAHGLVDSAILGSIASNFNGRNFAAFVELSRFCSKTDVELGLYAIRRNACSQVLEKLRSYQCYIDVDTYEKETSKKIASHPGFSKAKPIVDALLGKLLKKDSISSEGKKIYAGAIGDILINSQNNVVKFDNNWFSRSLFKVALAEKEAGAPSELYLERLDEAIVADKYNLKAIEILVIDTAETQNASFKELGLKYLSDIASKKNWSAAKEVEVRASLEKIPDGSTE